jgi:protein phosphatase
MSKPSQDIPMTEEEKKKAESERQAALAKIKDPYNAHEILEVAKQVPQARFGHTITMVHKYKVVLFGGATGDTGKYSMTGETFIFNILLKTWTELNVKGVPPSPRAAHASTNVEQMQMVVYGGATGGGSLASDDLYLLDMRNGEDQA